MSSFTVTAVSGERIPTISMKLKEGDKAIAQVLLLPHSLELYELHLSSVHWSVKGRMIDIAKAGLVFLFNDLKKVQKLIVTIPVNNRLAIRLAKHVMKYEGTLTKSFLLDGQMIDQDIYGITREEVKCPSQS